MNERLTSVAARLAAEPYRFSFFQAVRLLKRTGATPAEPIRFRTDLSLDFPASEIRGYSTARGSPELTVTFLGLTGPSGVLPRHYTETLLARRFDHRDGALHGFLDLFSERLIALFYAAWEKHRFYVPLERREASALTQIVLDLVGMGPRSLQRRLVDAAGGLRDETLVYYGGLAAQRPRSAWSLARIVGDRFRVTAEVRSLRGRWIPLPAESRLRLGNREATLDAGVALGARAWECQSKIELVLGPLARPQFEALLPGGARAQALQRLVRWFIGPTIDCAIRLVLGRDEAAGTRLGSARLGYTTWLGAPPAPRDRDDVVFDCAGA